MKKGFAIVLILYIVFGCKIREKKAVTTPVETAKTEAPNSVNRPVVNSVIGKYNFIDSTAAKVFLKVEIASTAEDLSVEKLNEIFKVQWTLQTDYGIKERLESGKLAFTKDFVRVEDGFYYFSFDIPKIKGQAGAILLTEFLHPASGTKFSFDMTLDFGAKRSITRYEIYNDLSDPTPRFLPFVKLNESFVVKSVRESNEPLFLIRYLNKTKPALAPTSGTKREVLSEFEIVETLEIKDRKPLTLTEPGMYVLTQTPENVIDGYGFLVPEERYPRDTNPASLKEALAYMSTSKELEATVTYENAKDGLDMYFLNLAKGDENLAKKIIRSYYKRIEEANEIFTTYKEGWKTDKGMVYIIMGPPARVQRNRTREVWLYSQNRNTSEIIYTFYKRPNVFSEQNYELVRYPEYSAFWYPYVEAWRTGKIME